MPEAQGSVQKLDPIHDRQTTAWLCRCAELGHALHTLE